MERHRALIRRLLPAALLFYLVGSAFVGFILAWTALEPPRFPVSAEDDAAAAVDGFAPIKLSRPDGADLRAWLIWPKGAADLVLVLHGIGDNRVGMKRTAQWLAQNGYAVLVPDARGQGMSSGLTTYGVLEAGDIHAWVEQVAAARRLRCVYGLGESLGGAELLQALPLESRFCAVVAEDAYATFRQAAYARLGLECGTGPWIGRTLFSPAIELGFLYVRAKYGVNLGDAAPVRSVEGISTPVLLIQGQADQVVPPPNADQIESHNPAHVTVWRVPGAAHVAAYQTAPKEFERRVLDWFQSHKPRGGGS